MAVDPAKLQAEYNAQSALNADALSAFTTAYPLVYVGNTFTDYNGLDWKYKAILPFRNTVTVFAAYVDPVDGETDYIANINAIMMQRAKYTFAEDFATAAATTAYTRPDMAFVPSSDILEVTIDGGSPLNPATDYTWNDSTSTITFLIAINPAGGQDIHILYKKSPYYYGYP